MANTFKVWKYELGSGKEGVVEMPRSAQVLEVDWQPHGDSVSLCIWALVMPDQPKVKRRTLLVDTNEEIPAEVVETFEHVKTLQAMAPRLDAEGNLVPKSIVFHLFLERNTLN